jgi:hypothetical protein
MKNVDVEIYLNQFVTFFKKNPEELKMLIGNVDEEIFFTRVEEQCNKNLEKGEDVEITRNQILDILVDLRSDEVVPKSKIEDIFLKTKFGQICMN